MPPQQHDNDAAYQRTTRDITVRVQPQYLESESEPQIDRYVWAYHVSIENDGTEAVRLRRRYWHITDANGTQHEVEGEGVVGEQPLLEPGERFQYTSGTPLSTASGFMLGRYTMEVASGERFDVEIPPFSLDSPSVRPVIN